MKTLFYPILLRPVYQTYLWGGQRMKKQLGRTDTPGGIVAESWEVSDRADGMSVVANGVWQGLTLRDLVKEFGPRMLGTAATKDVFPLLIKVLDADKTLSVQVHPNDGTAARFGGEAKTEMWYVLDAEPDAVVYCGLNVGVTPEAFRSAIEENRLEKWLHVLPVKKGDAVFVPGGRVHAIGAGCLLLEVQQNSNTTYRIYDWGRVGSDGKSRQLHIEEALRVSTWDDIGADLAQPSPLTLIPGLSARSLILESDYFRMEKWTLGEKVVLKNDGKSFQVLFAATGDLRVSAGREEVLVKRGSSVLLPAALAEALILPAQAGAEMIRITLPE